MMHPDGLTCEQVNEELTVLRRVRDLAWKACKLSWGTRLNHDPYYETIAALGKAMDEAKRLGANEELVNTACGVELEWERGRNQHLFDLIDALNEANEHVNRIREGKP